MSRRFTEALQVAAQAHPEKMTVKNVNKYLTAFGMLLDYCVEAGHIETNPAKGLTIRTTKKPAHEERKRFSDEDIAAFIPRNTPNFGANQNGPTFANEKYPTGNRVKQAFKS